jgi:thioredoxin reductase (NADPH)
MHKSEVALIGAGPIGIELAVKLKENGINYVHFEAGCIGSTINWYAPNTSFFSGPERIAIAGVPIPSFSQKKTTKEEYLAYLRSVVSQFNLEIKTFTKVLEIAQLENGFVLTYSSIANKNTNEILNNRPYGVSQKLKAKKIILAIGDMHHPKLLNIEGEDLPHVNHYLEDPHNYYDQNVLIVGGRNSAIEAAIRLYRAGAKVSLSYRCLELPKDSIKYWLYPEFEYLVRKQQISFYPNTKLKKINYTSVDLNNSLSIIADKVLLLTGYSQNKDLFTSLGIKLRGEGQKPQFSKKTMETNIENVFVAGTASAGTQSSGVKEFIETSHLHVTKIIAKIKNEELSIREYDVELLDREN